MKQTAVEWLANRIIDLEERLRLKEINLNDFIEEKDLLVEQAKEMEKEQKGYSKEEVDNLLNKLLENNMCSHAGDELIEQFKKN